MKQANLLTICTKQKATICRYRVVLPDFIKKVTVHPLVWVAVVLWLLFLGSCKTCQCPAYSSVSPSAAEITAQNRMETSEPTAWVQSVQGMLSNGLEKSDFHNRMVIDLRKSTSKKSNSLKGRTSHLNAVRFPGPHPIEPSNFL